MKDNYYSHLFNRGYKSCQITKRGGWNKRGGWIFWKKLVHKSNKRGVEGGKISEINKRVGWIFDLCRVEFLKFGKRDFTFIREMRVYQYSFTYFSPHIGINMLLLWL